MGVRMILNLPLHVARGYKSAAQRARRLTEDWFGSNVYCPACPSDSLEPTPANTKVVDFVCPRCSAEFQLKAKNGSLGRRLRDAAYAPMMARIEENTSPHFAFLQYSNSDWRVRNLLFVPGHFITAGAIERCKPLSPDARRAGWVGCNIVLSHIPPDGRIPAVRDWRVAQEVSVRRQWHEFTWMATRSTDARGWMADVLVRVRRFGTRQFSLAEVYEFEGELGALHPANRNVRAKIRQQLQVLRDRGVIRFLGRGRYIATGAVADAL